MQRRLVWVYKGCQQWHGCERLWLETQRLLVEFYQGCKQWHGMRDEGKLESHYKNKYRLFIYVYC